jgi:hypothetical protein
MVEQRRGGGRYGVDRLAEGLGVMPGGRAEAADLADVLQRGGTDVVVGYLLGVGRAKGLDASAHAFDGTKGYSRPSKPSRPTVRPTGREPMPRIASSTPGMNDARSSES